MAKSVPDREPLQEESSPLDRQALASASAVPPAESFSPRSTDESPSGTVEPAGSDAAPEPQTRSKRRRPFFLRLWFLTLVALGAGLTVGALRIEEERQAILATLPDPEEIFTFARPDTLTIKTQDGTILQTTGPATRTYTKLSDIPLTLQRAFIAAEDRRYYQHTGVDYQAIARALKANFDAGEVVEGGSTLTQQLARVVFLDQDPNLDRKIREALLAQQIEQTLTKGEILERYLNLVYLGSGAYGVADAAWIYYSKALDELTLSEMATLAGLPPAPSVYSPLINPEFAQERRDKVLDWMVREEFISQREADAAKAEPIAVNPSAPKYFDSLSPYFTTFVKKELTRYLTPDRIAQGGLVLETTIDLEWQRFAEDSLRNLVANQGYYQNFDQAAFAAIDPQTGAIKVMVGGANFESSQFNRVTQAQRQPGSTFKTFVYTAAIAAGFPPSKTYVDAPIEVDGYKPKNYGGSFRGPVSIVEALVSSVNIVSLKTLLDVGFDPVIETAQQMGLRSNMEATYSLALGAWEMNLLEMTSAYGTLANEGVHVPPHGIARVLTQDGRVLYDVAQDPTVQAVDPDIANTMTWMLQQVVSRGTGGNARLPDRPVAGKTGTSESARDLWFVGYIPQLAAGVWLGNDDNRPTWGASSTAALLWGDIMRELTRDLEPQTFPELPDLRNREATLEAQPIKPRRVVEGSIDREEGGYEDLPAGEETPGDVPTETTESTDSIANPAETRDTAKPTRPAPAPPRPPSVPMDPQDFGAGRPSEDPAPAPNPVPAVVTPAPPPPPPPPPPAPVQEASPSSE
ncbi:MAG: PBP1A family penicillin-binding protein [Prochlorothrix sp.]|nr:PBP1A family penicillin-binding protein [Prochlorothrix sp.]